MASSPPEIKNVLIVGLGYAGANAVQSLSGKLPATHRIVAVHESSFGYNPISCLRAATVPGWEKQATAPLDGLFPAGTRHLLLASHRAVKLNAHSVILDSLDDGKQTELQFDYALIATGSTYDFPCRPPSHARTETQARDELKSLQTSLHNARSVLVIGGGPAGCEAAGEVASQYPERDKTVTLLHSHSRLFDTAYSPKFGDSLKSQLEGRGGRIHYDCRLQLGDLKTGPIAEQLFRLPDGTDVQADFIFITFGCKPNSNLIRTLDPTLLDTKGYVLVKPTLQLDGTLDGESLDHIFAPGDVNAIPENKLAGAAARHAWAASSNILSLIRGKTTGLKTYSPAGPHAQIISIGPDGGAAEVAGYVLGPWLVSRFFSRGLGRRHFAWSFNTKL